ncbi:MAG: MBOAT family protein [Firmicutes bacterium]|nr:MBOAT family protein [Bacillota bacterium]
MSFTSNTFLYLFLPLSLIIFLIAKKARPRSAVLLAFSLLFYAYSGLKGLLFMLVFAAFIWICGRAQERLAEGRRRDLAYGVAVLAALAPLFCFKYWNYTGALLRSFGVGWPVVLKAAVPLGISFITFSAISYVTDVRRRQAPAGTFPETLLYLLLFTKAASGPIVRWEEFRTCGPQQGNAAASGSTLDDFYAGCRRAIIGLAKKLLLADYFGSVIVTIEAGTAGGSDWLTRVFIAVLYTLQIYYDFSGYSDIAIGLSRCFGYRFRENFNYPYRSRSITEFWRRWHISLGEWFREYLYIPLGGNRRGKRRTLLNLAIVFLATGIWHGAGLNYLFWGCLHGAAMLVERVTGWAKKTEKKPLAAGLGWIITILIVGIGWQAFRLDGGRALFSFYRDLLDPREIGIVTFTWRYFLNPRLVTMALIGVLGVLGVHEKALGRLRELAEGKPAWAVLTNLGLIALFLLALMMMVNADYRPFIYFQY